MSVVIEPMTLEDLESVARIHLARLQSDFSTALGKYYLKNVFYPWYINQPAGFAFVARQHGRVVGFNIGSEDSWSFYSQMLRSNFLKMCISVFGALIRRPSFLFQMLSVGRIITSGPRPLASADWGYLALSSEATGQGVGKLLVDTMIDHLRDRGHTHMWGKCALDNKTKDMDRYFKKIGFVPYAKFYSCGRPWAIYMLDLNQGKSK